MKHIKKLNEAIADENVIAGFAEALVIYMDGQASNYRDELDNIADKYDWGVVYQDNSATFIPNDEPGDSDLFNIKKTLGIEF